MKRLFIIGAFMVLLALPVQAEAVRLAPGSGAVEELPPLQPIPEGTAPNVSKNIQDNGSEVAPTAPTGDAETPVTIAPTNDQAASLSAKGLPVGKQVVVLVVGIGILALIALGVWTYMRRRKADA